MTTELNKTMTQAGVTYNTVHWWIRREFGSAIKCDSATCKKESPFFEWALKRNRRHDKKIENYFQLCKKCHFSYDFGAEHKKVFDAGRVNAQKARIGTTHTEETKNKISNSKQGHVPWNKGKPFSEEVRLKMSLAARGRVPWNKGLKKI
jgi:hypothetical protein